MKKAIILCVLFGLFPATWAGSLEDVLNKHMDAHGGKAKWAAVKTMTITGNYSGFSVSKPFVMHLARPHKVFFDHHLGEMKVTLGAQADDYWYMFQSPIPTKMPPADQKVTRQWADIGTPFFTYKEDGCKVEYLGEQELDGESGLALKLTRPNGEVETWYLDEDYMAFARESIGSDFGRETRQVTYFSNYKDVEGLKIPHYTEITFNTRYRVMDIKKVTINDEVDVDLFAMPLPMGMQEIRHLLGEWKVTASTKPNPSGDWVDQETTATIKALAGNTMFLEEITVDLRGPRKIARTWAYDPYRQHYTVMSTDDTFGFPSVLNGAMEDGSLTLNTLKSDTPRADRGRTHMSVTISEITKDRFVMKRDFSRDEGKTWSEYIKMVYERVK